MGYGTFTNKDNSDDVTISVLCCSVNTFHYTYKTFYIVLLVLLILLNGFTSHGSHKLSVLLEISM